MAVQISGNDITVPRDGTFSRNVSIAGTLTYEDVTNVDSIGLVTARNGIEVGASPGVAASISVDGNMIVSGISTFGGDVQVPDKIIHSGDTNTAIRFPAADTVSVETGGTERVRIDSSGRMGIGDDSPDRELVVKHASSNSTIKIESANTHTSQLMFADSDGEQIGRVAVFHGSGQVTSDSLTLDTAGTARIRVEPAGNVNVAQNLKVAGVCTATSFSGSGANLTGISAISVIDSWRLTSSTSNGTNAIITSWAEATNKLNSNLGSALGHSSGTFSFPSTGHYLLTLGVRFYCASGNDASMNVVLKVTTDNSSYEDAALTTYGAHEGNTRSSSSLTYAFDITDVSNQKFQFHTDSMGGSSSVTGHSTENQTYFQVIRLADT